MYGSAPNRGLELVLSMWPRIAAALPGATLKVYYGFSASFVKWGAAHMGPGFAAWRARMERLLHGPSALPGVVYVGMVDHVRLAAAYAEAHFSLYPTVYPETGCVSLMKAQAMGAVPVTSRFAGSTLPELCGEWDLGPRPINGSSYADDPGWAEEWAGAVVAAARRELAGEEGEEEGEEGGGRGLGAHRAAMMRWARRRFLWSTVAGIWADTFAAGRARPMPRTVPAEPVAE